MPQRLNSQLFTAAGGGLGLADPGAMAFTSQPSAAILVGRSLAAFVHPIAAWRSRSRAYRAHVIVTYAAAGYVLTLTALTTLLPRF